MPAWPTSLNLRQKISGYSEDLPQQVLRTDTDQGPKKTRRRFTSAPRNITFSITGTSTDADVLDTFYIDTINGGAASFTMVNPRTGSTDTFRFLEPPKFSPMSHDHWSLACKVEKLP